MQRDQNPPLTCAPTVVNAASSVVDLLGEFAAEANIQDHRMKLGIHQPYFFPYIGYFHNIQAADDFVLCDRVQFAKGGWVDRNSIRANTPTGSTYIRPQLTKSSGSKFLIEELRLSTDDYWRNKLLKFIWHSYKNAQCVDEVYPFMQDLIACKPETLSDFNFHSVKALCELLGIETRLHFNAPELDEVERELDALTAEYNRSMPIHRRQVRVIEFCKRMGMDTYINTVGGVELYDREAFAAHGLGLEFVKSQPLAYVQFEGKPFVPNLSVIDVLMHSGPQGARAFLNNFELV